MQQVLIDEVKNYLNKTWEGDELTDRKIVGIISRAEATLNDYAGKTLEFCKEINGEYVVNQTKDTQLLLDCCRYIDNDCFEDFKINFAADLFNLRARCQVESMESGEENEE